MMHRDNCRHLSDLYPDGTLRYACPVFKKFVPFKVMAGQIYDRPAISDVNFEIKEALDLI